MSINDILTLSRKPCRNWGVASNNETPRPTTITTLSDIGNYMLQINERVNQMEKKLDLLLELRTRQDLIDKKQDLCLKKLARIKVELKRSSTRLEDVLNSANVVDLRKFPMKSLKELEDFENQLESNSTYKNKVIIEMKKKFKDKPIDTMVKFILADNVLTEFSFGGKCKRCFKDLTTFQLLKDIRGYDNEELLHKDIKRVMQ